jgi:hypothetical protein
VRRSLRVASLVDPGGPGAYDQVSGTDVAAPDPDHAGIGVSTEL